MLDTGSRRGAEFAKGAENSYSGIRWHLEYPELRSRSIHYSVFLRALCALRASARTLFENINNRP